MCRDLKIRSLFYVLIGAAIVVGVYLFVHSPSVPDIDSATSKELNAAAEKLWTTRLANHSADVPKTDWPNAISKFSPLGVRMNDDGVYVVLKRLFVEESGLFLLPMSSVFQPSTGGDPSYRQLRGQVYWY